MRALFRFDVLIAVLFLCAITPCAAPGQETAAESPQEKPVPKSSSPLIIIPPFENMSQVRAMTNYEVMTSADPNYPKRTFTIDRYTEAPRAVLEDILMQIPNVTVIERQRVDALLMEAEFGRLSALVDVSKAVQLGKLLGATAVLMGTVMDVSERHRSFSGYGIQTESTVVTASLRVRLIDIATGKITASRISKGLATFMRSSYGGTGSSDVAFEAIEAALEGLRSDEEFKAAVGGGAKAASAKKLKIRFEPIPANCDIEVDGSFVGNSPLDYEANSGDVLKVQISKPGYASWIKNVRVQADLKITPELEKRLEPPPVEKKVLDKK